MQTAYIKNPENPKQLINVKNGLLDLTSMKLISSPLEFSSLPLPLSKLNVSYNSAATCPTFDRFLDDVCKSSTNAANGKAANNIAVNTAATDAKTDSRKQFLLEFMGAIFSNVPASKFNKQVLFLFGPNDTGKTQIKRLVEEMLGYDNFSILGADCPISKMKRALKGRRLSGSGDMSKAEFRWLQKVLRETDERAAGRAAGFDGFWWFNMNPRPDFNSLSKSEKEQIVVFEFPNVIPVENRDCEILEKMLAERDGIFLKAVRAFTAMKNMKAMKDFKFLNFHVAG